MIEGFAGFARDVSGIGSLSLGPFEPDRHVDCAHRWLTSPHARFWGMTANTRAETVAYFEAIEAASTHRALLGRHDDAPAFLVEVYDPAAEPVGRHYPVQPGDLGMHILIAPPERPIHGFTWAVFALTVTTLLVHSGVERLVVEPDVDNAGIHVLNQRAGFVYHRRLEMADKTAWLATCSARDHETAMAQLADSHRLVCPTRENTQ